MRTPFQAGSLLFHPKWLPYPALPYPALPYRSAGQKVHWYSRLPYIQGYWGRWNSDLSWVLLNSKLRSTHLDCFFYDFQGLHFPWNRSSKYFFRKKRIPTGPFFVIQSPQFMMSTTLSWLSTSISAGVAIPWPDLLNKPSVQRIVQVRQAKAEKVKSVNKTGISADQCRILMNVTSNPTDLIPLSK